MIVLGIFVYIVCGVLAYGLTLAAFQVPFTIIAERDFKDDRKRALYTALFGPAGLVFELFSSQLKHGFMFNLTYKEPTK